MNWSTASLVRQTTARYAALHRRSARTADDNSVASGERSDTITEQGFSHPACYPARPARTDGPTTMTMQYSPRTRTVAVAAAAFLLTLAGVLLLIGLPIGQAAPGKGDWHLVPIPDTWKNP